MATTFRSHPARDAREKRIHAFLRQGAEVQGELCIVFEAIL